MSGPATATERVDQAPRRIRWLRMPTPSSFMGTTTSSSYAMRPRINSPTIWVMSLITGSRGSRNGSEVSSRLPIICSSGQRRPSDRSLVAALVDPLEEIGDTVATRDFARVAQLEQAQADDPSCSKGWGTNHSAGKRPSKAA